MKKLDIYKASDEEMANSQIDFYISRGVFKRPEDVDKTKMDIETDWFKSLSDADRKNVFTKTSDEWWNSIAKEHINNKYSDALMEADIKGSIKDWWDKYLKDNLSKFGDITGIKKYVNAIKNNKTRITEDDYELFNQHMSNYHEQFDEDSIENIKQALQTRRLKGGCGMWQNVGIPYLYKHHKDKLLPFEVEWYEKKIGLGK